MLNRTLHIVSLIVLVALILTGCDSTGSSDTLDVTAEETAESIAYALATDTGGALDDAEDAATATQIVSGALSALNAQREAEATDVRSNDCEFGLVTTCDFTLPRDLPRSDINFERIYEIRLFKDGELMRPVALRTTTPDSIRFTIVEGLGSVVTQRIDNEYTIRASDWVLSDLGDNAPTINGASSRSMTGTLTRPNGTRNRIADVTTTFEDVVWIRDEGPESGTIRGTYDAEVTITRDGESATRTVDVAYTVTFTDGEGELTFTGGGSRFNGETFTFDVDSGELTGSAS